MTRPAADRPDPRRLLLLAALATPLATLAAVSPTLAQDGPAMAEPSEEIAGAVEDFFHFGKLGRYELAAQLGEQILDADPEPTALLAAFRTAARERGDNLDDWLGIWTSVDNDAMNDVTGRLVEKISAGRAAVATDPQFIDEQIRRLSVSSVGFGNGLENLRRSGEVAVPAMLQVLQNPDRRDEHSSVKRALRQLGRGMLNPLTAATEADDTDLLTEILLILGDLGYGDAGPFVEKVLTRDNLEPGVRQAAEQALDRLPYEPKGAAEGLYDLAEKLYYGTSSVTADTRYPQANVWRWEGDRLTATQVPQPIFNEIRAMDAAADALELSRGMDEAVSLWLAANYKRAAELPEGETDATRGENEPGPQYYGVTAGSSYVAQTLRRALDDKNPAVALMAIESLQSVLGDSALGDDAAAPLIDAMNYADRRVRFESALALAGALPRSDFEGSQLVVPLLGEALSQTGNPTIIVVAPTRDRANSMAEGLTQSGYQVETATTASEAATAAQGLNAVDAVVVEDQLPQGEVDRVFDVMNAGSKTRGSARLVITASRASRFEAPAQNDPLLSTTQATSGEALATAVERARTAAGSLPLDEQLATEYALRSAAALQDVSDSSAGVYNLASAKSALLTALDDDREEVVLAAADVLGALDDADAQTALLQSAQDNGRSADSRIGLYEALAKNARNYGNRLPGDNVSDLQDTVREEANLDIRTAAAKAYGALDLPADEAKQIIINR